MSTKDYCLVCWMSNDPETIIRSGNTSKAGTCVIRSLLAERDEYKRRAEAAEHDLQAAQGCDSCKYCLMDGDICARYSAGENACGAKWCAGYEWRGPCAENGGANK